MTTREIYFKNLVFCDLPMGLVGYTYEDKNGVADNFFLNIYI
jgi:hypothetical protein